MRMAFQGCHLPPRRLQHSQEVEVKVALMPGIFYSSAGTCQSDSHATRGCMHNMA